MVDYESFLGSPSATHWKKLGLVRRSGILAPLFSIRSRRSAGVGEYPDLELLADWCRACGMSLIQLLPLNDVGTRFCPYDSESSFALEPLHLALDDLAEIPTKKYAPQIKELRLRYSASSPLFDTNVKAEKLKLLRRIFAERPVNETAEFRAFKEEQVYWLPAYALFKVLKEQNQERAWETWPQALKTRQAQALRAVAEVHEDDLHFHEWLQWQLYRQFKASSARIRRKKVRLLGDLPFLVSRDSADVWAHPEYFKLNLSAGAPPDLYFADGQEWGMPPYHWSALAAGDFDYIKERLRYASNFYDLYRLDHFVGLFRVWAFPREEAPDRKQRAFFDPPESETWEKQARSILNVMLRATSMLPCAEDLGTVPDAARALLEEYALPGMDVQRWMRDWKGTGDYLPVSEYRRNSIVTLSTHDMTSFLGWWRTEATPEDKLLFRRFTGLPEKDPDPAELCGRALEKAQESPTVFSVHSFQDWMTFCGVYTEKDAALRINEPGFMKETNWRLRIPLFLEDMLELPCNKLMADANRKASRQ